MKKGLWFILIFSFIWVVSAAAQQQQQGRTVTNEHLEKYRQKRVAAERDLRENYERLGFPSPAELEKQTEQDRAERSELAARLEAENLERAQLDLERQRVMNEARRNLNYQLSTENNERYEDGYFENYGLNGFYSYPNFNFPKYGFPNNRYQRYNSGVYRRGYGNFPRVEYRNNLPVIIPPTRYTRWGGGGRKY